MTDTLVLILSFIPPLALLYWFFHTSPEDKARYAKEAEAFRIAATSTG